MYIFDRKRYFFEPLAKFGWDEILIYGTKVFISLKFITSRLMKVSGGLDRSE